jgi:hypothetical protein
MWQQSKVLSPEEDGWACPLWHPVRAPEHFFLLICSYHKQSAALLCPKQNNWSPAKLFRSPPSNRRSYFSTPVTQWCVSVWVTASISTGIRSVRPDGLRGVTEQPLCRACFFNPVIQTAGAEAHPFQTLKRKNLVPATTELRRAARLLAFLTSKD